MCNILRPITILAVVLVATVLTPLNAAVVTTNTNALALANTLVGPGITVLSATFVGGPTQAGTFTSGGNAATGVGFDSGIVLSSGDVSLIPGANVTLAPGEAIYSNNSGSNTLSTIVGTPGDAALTAIAGAPTFDASSLSITFQFGNGSTGGNLFFNFVFGSEEYIDYVTPPGFRGFNDVFGFFVDGVNIALVGGQPITVNTINPVVNSGSYRNNVDNVNGYPNLGLNLKFDGLTTVLAAKSLALGPGQHTIRFAVADTLDQKLDAGVFLQAGSLTTSAPASISKAFGLPSVALGSSTTLSFTITNSNTTSALNNASFTDPLPAGISVATPANGLTGTCGGGTITAVPGSSTVSLTGATLAINSSCTFSVNVTGVTAGMYTNTTTGVTATPDIPGSTAVVGATTSADINVSTITVVPTLSKAFGVPSMLLGATTTLTFTLTNLNPLLAITGLGFADPLPVGITIATPNGLSSNCGGTATAVAGTNAVTLVAGILAANSSCTMAVNVLGTAVGQLLNKTTELTSTNAGTGLASSAGINILALPIAPALVKSFGAQSMGLNGSTTLTFTLSNTNAALPINRNRFHRSPARRPSDSTPNLLTSNCVGATISAVAGATNVAFSGLTLASNAICSFTISVTGVALGTQTNMTSTITSTNIPALPLGSPATAVIAIQAVADPDSAFQVRYASNLQIGDSVINLTNNGASASVIPLVIGNICVNVYAFSPDEQLVSCCSCLITPNGLASISARNDLINNTLTPGVPTSIVIKLVSTAGGALATSCNASAAGSNTNPLALGMVAYGTTIHPAPVTPGTPATTYNVTETRFTPATLGPGELTRITALCSFIQHNGSGFGICRSCRLGGLGAENR